MPTVDDLIVSLRIDDTGNLGKLQKQLTALVGPKGDKPIQLGAGIDVELKRDLIQIKADLMLLTPTVLTSKETVMRAAIGLINRTKADKGLTEKLLERYDMEEERLDEFIEELLNIANESSKLNNDQQKRFVAEMEKFMKIADMSEGDRKSIVTRLLKMLNEVAIMQQKVQESFRAVGVGFRGQYQVYQITESKIDNQFNEQIKHYEAIDDDRFAKLKVIFKDISDPLRAMEKAYELMGMGVLDIEQLDKQTILDVAELKEILISQIAASIDKSTLMLEDFYKAGKGLTGGKAFGVGGPKKLDLVVKDGLKAFFEEHGGVVRFGELKDTETNILTELKLVATKESIEKTIQERINQGFTSIRLVAEEVKDTAIDAARELLSKEIYKDINLALIEILPRALQLSTGTAADLEQMHEDASEKVAEKIEEIAEKIDEEAKDAAKKADLETLQEFMLAADEDLGNIKDVGGDVSDLVKATEKGFLDNTKEFMEIKGKEDEILKRLKEKELQKDKVEDQPKEF